MRFSGGLKPFDKQFVRFSTREATVVTWVTQSGLLGTQHAGIAISYTVTATVNVVSSISYSIVAGSLPAGVVLNPDSGIISGISSTVGMQAFTVRATAGRTYVDQSFAISTSTAIPDVTTWVSPAAGALPQVALGQTYSQTFVANSSYFTPETYTVVSGALPGGLTLSNAGVLSGTFTGPAGLAAFAIQATDAGGATAIRSFTLPVMGVPIWTGSGGSLGTVGMGQSFSFNVVATDTNPGFTGLTYSATGLPSTVSLITTANVATISGFVNGSTGPIWSTGGSLGTVFRQDPVSLKFVANVNPTTNASITSYSLVGDSTKVLPAGLTLAANGTVFGNADLYSKDLLEPPVTRYTAPLWTTNSNLGIQYVGNTISMPIRAIGQNGNSSTVTYAMSSFDILPFGLQLGLNGTISGSIDKTAVSQETPVSAPAPIWNTAAGPLGSLTNSTNSPNLVLSAITLQATPTFGSTISSYAILPAAGPTLIANGVMTANGALPEGIALTAAGVLSGTTSLYAGFGDTPNAAALPSPVWTTAAGSLGNANNGQALTLNLAVTPRPNTSVSFFVSNGAIPAGTYLTTTNSLTAAATITGTLDGNTTATSTTLSNARTFSFTIRALANTGGYADRNFTYTINVT